MTALVKIRYWLSTGILVVLSCAGGTTAALAGPPAASFKVVIRPETDALYRVNAVTIIEQIDPGDAERPLVLAAPLSPSGLTPIATPHADCDKRVRSNRPRRSVGDWRNDSGRETG